MPYNPFLKAETFFPNTNTSLSSLPATLSSASNVGITPSGYQHLFDVGGGHYASTSKGGDEKKRDDKLSANNDVKFSLMIPNSGASFKVNNNNRSHHRHNISEMTNAEWVLFFYIWRTDETIYCFIFEKLNFVFFKF